MTAVGTNVVLRLLTQDDRRQASWAASVFAKDEIWIAKTVLLETEWVLRSAYGFGADAVQRVFTMLLGLPNVQVEDEDVVAEAVVLLGKGLDFADALHLESRPKGSRFISLDKDFVRRARGAGVTGVDAAKR